MSKTLPAANEQSAAQKACVTELKSRNNCKPPVWGYFLLSSSLFANVESLPIEALADLTLPFQ